MERKQFEKLRSDFCEQEEDVRLGKMMSSDALQYRGKVFAFFSRKKKLVVKLGTSFDPTSMGIPLTLFNPFKKRGPLNGWFEVSFEYHDEWRSMMDLALAKVKAEMMHQSL
ncbi:MAG: hypothetical protein AAGC85_14935 [Bacteroidota bacterium]